MTDLGIMKYFLGIEVNQSTKGIFVCQQKYAADIIKRFSMEGCNPVETPIPLGTKLSKNDEGSTVDSTLYIFWSSIQWIICIICSKCSKMCFTMLKLPNRLLQWLQNVQKPLARLFQHLVWPKHEEDKLP
jgi:hypothetical protein